MTLFLLLNAVLAFAGDPISVEIHGIPAQKLLAAAPDFQTEDGIVSIRCDAVTVSCTLTILDSEDETKVRVGEDYGKIYRHAYFFTSVDAQRFYEPLDVKIHLVGGHNHFKYLTAEDGSFRIKCARSSIPNGNPYSCQFSVLLPQ